MGMQVAMRSVQASPITRTSGTLNTLKRLRMAIVVALKSNDVTRMSASEPALRRSTSAAARLQFCWPQATLSLAFVQLIADAGSSMLQILHRYIACEHNLASSSLLTRTQSCEFFAPHPN